MVQLHRGQVDCHAQIDKALVVPLAQLLAGLIQHPFANRYYGAVLLGQRNENIRRDKPVLRMLPTQQRLDTNHAMVAVVDLRLVHQVQLIVGEGFTQGFFQLAAAAHLGVDAGDVKLIAVARTTLRQGHGLFGFLQQLLGVIAVFREQRDTDGGTQANFLVFEHEWLL